MQCIIAIICASFLIYIHGLATVQFQIFPYEIVRQVELAGIVVQCPRRL
jgi:hypothetical protein